MNYEYEVFEIIKDLCGVEQVNASMALASDLPMDSLHMVMLLVMLEDTFEIELDESDMNPFALITVQDVIDVVVKYKSKSEVDENG